MSKRPLSAWISEINIYNMLGEGVVRPDVALRNQGRVLRYADTSCDIEKVTR